MVLVGPLAHVPPRFAEDGGGRHDVDAIDAGQVYSRHAEQRFAHVKLRGIALLASAPSLAGLLRQIGPRAAVGPLLEVLLQALIAFGHLLLAKFVAILLLLEHKQQVFLPVPLQAAGDLFFARLDPYIAQRRQGLWVTLASQNGLDDGLSRRPAQVADHVGQLHVHLRQHFLHTLDVPPRALHQVVALPPVSPQLANLLRRSERVAQQTIGVQLHQPLALLHVGLLTRQILGLPRVHQVHFQPRFLQNVVHRSPVHPCGLHSDGAHATLLQPRPPFLSTPPWCIQIAVPAGYPAPGVRPHSGLRCRYRSRRHPDAPPPGSGLAPGFSAPSPGVASGSSGPSRARWGLAWPWGPWWPSLLWTACCVAWYPDLVS